MTRRRLRHAARLVPVQQRPLLVAVREKTADHRPLDAQITSQHREGRGCPRCAMRIARDERRC